MGRVKSLVTELGVEGARLFLHDIKSKVIEKNPCAVNHSLSKLEVHQKEKNDAVKRFQVSR
jgi:hypothetical protein|tara:strand:- start:652 stop:834 length:183 start_codon:yes stop_codon:yes gene_type:complete